MYLFNIPSSVLWLIISSESAQSCCRGRVHQCCWCVQGHRRSETQTSSDLIFVFDSFHFNFSIHLFIQSEVDSFLLRLTRTSAHIYFWRIELLIDYLPIDWLINCLIIDYLSLMLIVWCQSVAFTDSLLFESVYREAKFCRHGYHSSDVAVKSACWSNQRIRFTLLTELTSDWTRVQRTLDQTRHHNIVTLV